MQKPIPATKKDVTYVPVFETMTDGQILVRAAEITKKSIESMTEDEILLRTKEITARRRENEVRQAEANRLGLEKKIEGQKKFYEEKEKQDLFLQKHVLAILKCIIRIWCKTSQTVMVTDVSSAPDAHVEKYS
jgi:hypothetical protein